MKVTLTADAKSLRALLVQLPRCIECRAMAEVALNGQPRCVNCAAKHRTGKCVTLAHADAAIAIESALSPHEPEGKWEAPCG